MHLEDQIIKDFVQYTYHVASSIPFQSQTAKSTPCSGPRKTAGFGKDGSAKAKGKYPDLQIQFQIKLEQCLRNILLKIENKE